MKSSKQHIKSGSLSSSKERLIEKKSILQSALAERVFNWHLANIEGACAADVSQLSLLYWDQDDP
jgi:hypothetical protein